MRAVPVVGVALALGLAAGVRGGAALAQRAMTAPQRATPAPSSSSHPAPVQLPPVVARPLTVGAATVDLHFGAALASRRIAGSSRVDTGPGVHFEMALGVTRRLEFDWGFGLRLPNGGDVLEADRYARINRELVHQTGETSLGNPYLRARYALHDPDGGAVRVGAEILGVAPLAERTAWSVGVGVPLHLVWRDTVRLETGAQFQVMFTESLPVSNVLTIPARLNVRVSARIVLGVVSGVVVDNVGRANVDGPRVPLGLQGFFRIERRIDLTVQWLYPAFAPLDTDVVAFGIGIVARAI